MHVCVQWYLTLCRPMDCTLLASSVHRIFQARILEWVSTPFSREFSWLRDLIHVSSVSCTGRQIFYHWATREALSPGITTFFFFFVLRVFKIYSCSNVQVSDTVFLSITTMRSQILEIPELIPAGSLYPLTSISLLPLPKTLAPPFTLCSHVH